MTSLLKASIFLVAAGVITFIGYKVYAGRKKKIDLAFPRNVVVVGDSITAFQYGYTKTLRGLLGSGNTVQVFGYSGKGTQYLAGQLHQVMPPGTTDVVIQGGVNDLASGRSTSTIKANIESMIDYAHSHGSRAVVITILPWAAHLKGKSLQLETEIVNQWLLNDSLADAVVNGASLGDSAGKLKSAYDSGDHLHLNLAGQQRLGELVYEQGFGG